ncbi:restriction endonuclease subunit S [Fluviibacter phosphoraccumulans]|uniref:restriction endonuclease subunit S n=1 Tax=Fluviibacter phosphoraccumulans TaxID=1751046 RepID=UPI0024E26A21|nr:restriction endonuclease subunit S [Fluviibacter phosphoraccumulans]
MIKANHSIDELFVRIRNGLPVKNQPELGGLPITRIETIASGVIDEKRVGFSGIKPGEKSDWLLNDGDILFSHINSPAHIGKVAIYVDEPPELIHGMNLLAFTPNPDLLHPKFGLYLLRSKEFKRELAKSVKPAVNQASVAIADIKKIRVNVPKVSEQKRIAAILDKADSLRRKRQQAISLADDFLRAVFLDMFGDPVTNLKGWPVSELKALGQVSTGRTPPGDKPGMFDGETPFVTPGDLENDAPAKRSLTEAGVAEVSTVRSGATLVCCIGATIGKMGKATQRSAFNQQINAVEWNGLVDDDYGLAALRFFKAEIARQGASTTLPILKKSSFEKLRIPVPPIELQQAFAEQVATAERLRFSTKTSLAEIESLQAALQNESFA